MTEKRKTAVISELFPNFAEELEKMGFDILKVQSYKNNILNAESFHADMQILVISDKTIVLLKNNINFNNSIKKIIGNKINYIYTKDEITDFRYPFCVKLNIALVGKYAIGNFKYADTVVTETLLNYGFNLINVKQGYAKCSSAIVGDNAIITSDLSIAKAVSGKLDCLKISEGQIKLCDKYGGFIGGSSFMLNENTLAFMGDIAAHTDYENIKSFCKNHNIEIIYIKNTPLTDVGGVILLP